MSLQVSDFPNPYSSTPLQSAYAWISFLACDFSSGGGNLVVNVNMDTASAIAHKPPIAQVSILLGDNFPTLQQVVSDNQAAFDQIRAYLYTKLKARPEFKNSTEVP